jgi:predicted 3-demethylubiquinone-9 3-methyltransferase (glyoxalase superfamily)
MNNYMQKITPYLWFNGRAEEAMDFYVSVFDDAVVCNVNRIGDNIVTGSFSLYGQQFMVLDGGPMFSFSPAISFFVNCETQEEVDRLWTKLCDGGEEQMCGWLTDKFGVSWQIIPTALGRLMNSTDATAAQRVMQAMLKMRKIIIADLEAAHKG